VPLLLFSGELLVSDIELLLFCNSRLKFDKSVYFYTQSNETIMNEFEYLEKRVEDQISWYDSKSAWHKKWFIRLKIMEIILALIIPFLTGYITADNIELKVWVGIIGLAVAIVTGLITLFKLQENWIQYRTVAESLKHEKFLFVTKTGPYKKADSFFAFVERFESYISKENTQWASYVLTKHEDQQEDKQDEKDDAR
jgi:hypothetical protein